MKPFAAILLFIIFATASAQSKPENELRTYTAFPGELAQAGWKALDLETLDKQQKWYEERLPELETSPNGRWYDVRPILEEMDIEFRDDDFAVWNEPTRALVVRTSKNQAAKLDEMFGPWTDYTYHQVLVEALCIRCAPAPDPAVYLEGVPTVSEVLEGKMGKPELANRVSLRGKSGQRGKIIRENTGNIKNLLFEFDPVIGVDQYTIDLNFNYEVEFTSGVSFMQISGTTLSSDHPLLVELGGAGTEESPMHYLILRASIQPLKMPRTDSMADPFSEPPKGRKRNGAAYDDPFSDLGQ